MRRSALTASPGDNLPAIGESYKGGYFAGVMDVNGADYSRVNLENWTDKTRYALILSPRNLEVTGKYWANSTTIIAGTRTRWNGLLATSAIGVSMNLGAGHCNSLSYPSGDGASKWYLPALDELELLYRSFKPTTTQNYSATSGEAPTFPGGTVQSGVNPSSYPRSPSRYTSFEPEQTSLQSFRGTGSNSNGFWSNIYWSSTSANNTTAWVQSMSDGKQGTVDRTTTTVYTRPVRRFVL